MLAWRTVERGNFVSFLVFLTFFLGGDAGWCLYRDKDGKCVLFLIFPRSFLLFSMPCFAMQGIGRIMLCCGLPLPARRAVAARLALWRAKLNDGVLRRFGMVGVSYQYAHSRDCVLMSTDLLDAMLQVRA